MTEEEALFARARESLRAARIMIREDLANIPLRVPITPCSMSLKHCY
jgi:hypothetical protein